MLLFTDQIEFIIDTASLFPKGEIWQKNKQRTKEISVRNWKKYLFFSESKKGNSNWEN